MSRQSLSSCRIVHALAPALAAAALACSDTEPSTAPTAPPASTPSLAIAATQRVVNSLADPGDGTCNARECTLREALNDPGSTGISFAAGLTGPLTLGAPNAGGGTLVIDHSLTITGPRGGLVIRRNAADPGFRILRVQSDINVTLTDLTIRNGRTALQGGGGGIANYGTLTLVRCTVDRSSSTSGAGGIDSHGSLTLAHSTVADNEGTGIVQHNHATLRITNSTVARNTAAGIENLGGELVLARSSVMSNGGGGVQVEWGTSSLDLAKITDNTTSSWGGGISLFRGALTLTNSTVARNSAVDGGGVANIGGDFDISRSTLNNNTATNRGGGIFSTVDDNFGRLSGRVTLTNSTVSRNAAAVGGGIENSDRLGGAHVAVLSSTVALNSAREAGGGVHNGEDGFENSNSVSLHNTLVARNSAPDGPDAVRAFAQFSLIGDGTGSGLTNTNGNQVGKVAPNSGVIDPRIGALADNGGPTRTHALLAGSPAIDAASATDSPARDQRGVARPRGPGDDVGSYER
jgi:CSLREA domain-containing protein